MTARIYLARHATADSSRKDLQYDVLPGPKLNEQGEVEALQMGEFLRAEKIKKIYTSPFERTQRTAQLAAGVIGVPVITQEELSEWRHDETAQDVHGRLDSWFENICRESGLSGPVCLVSHGGPLGVMLTNLGMPREVVNSYCLKYGESGTQPAPPAGVWRAARSMPGGCWQLDLVYMPNTKLPDCH
jgi:broad specificity phosphatase PhoE